MKNSVYDIKYVNTINLIIVYLIQPVSRTVICGGPRHVFEIQLKYWQKSKAFNKKALCGSLFWKTSQTLLENICDKDLFK